MRYFAALTALSLIFIASLTERAEAVASKSTLSYSNLPLQYPPMAPVLDLQTNLVAVCLSVSAKNTSMMLATSRDTRPHQAMHKPLHYDGIRM